MNTPNVDGRAKHEVLAEILDNRPWRGPTYFLSLIVYHSMITLFALPLFLSTNIHSSFFGFATNFEPILIAVTLDVLAFFPRRRIMKTSEWLSRGLKQGYFLGTKFGTYIKTIFFVAHVVFLVFLVTVIEANGEYDSKKSLDLMGGLDAGSIFNLITAGWIVLVSFFPPMIPIINRREIHLDKRSTLNRLPLVLPYIRFPLLVGVLGVTWIALVLLCDGFFWQRITSTYESIFLNLATVFLFSAFAIIPCLYRIYDIRVCLQQRQLLRV